ncbi:hypothetical protein HKCCE3408_02120 [Rhodobacterales bacterium HKCCE3408]|nr:hypothetical protein [Rhodobacterales bacterium HKCCE3408]
MNVSLSISASEAWIFLPLVLPVCLWVVYTDLKDMLIRNVAVLALLAGFVVLGPFALPFTDYLWRFAHFGVVLAIGFVATSTVGVGAGDSKFAAAAAPFVALADCSVFLLLLSFTSIGGLLLHRIARRVPVIVNATPDWVSWEDQKQFPWGVSLASALVLYLVFGITTA